jgi:hypothetical protein
MSTEKAKVEDEVLTPPEIIQCAENAVEKLIPKASKEKYDRVYHEFMKWRVQRNANSFSDRTILAYLNEKKSKVAPNTLWGIYSMLKATLLAYHNVDISKYEKLTSFLKQNATGYQPKKAKIFLKEDIDKFLLSAPDEQYLMKKVCIFLFF